MDKQILAQYLDACELVKETQNEIRRLEEDYDRYAMDSVKGSNPNFPYQPVTIRIEGCALDPYKTDREHRRLMEVLNERLDNANSLRVDVEAWINTVPMRVGRIIRMKYLQGMTWASISMRLGMDSKDGAKKVFDRYMEREEKI